jgi:D-3-phosphoglycerate dehydrogenase
MYNILKLNSISSKADCVFDENYALLTECENPDGILLRSFNMADYAVSDSLLAVGRAGAGVNNIPHADYIKKGVVVFNTPGANANAVKELVITSLLLCSRDIIGGINWANGLHGEDVAKQVEKGKAQFGGTEILGKTLGIIGLGAIGVLVAEAAIGLGMKVIGYDAFLNPSVAENLKDRAIIAKNIEELYAVSDFITIHVPYLPATKNMINADSISLMKNGASIINLARGELVNNSDIKIALESGKISKYVLDFPTEDVLNVKNLIAMPHLGASTEEAEDNCAIMASSEIRDYIENGNIKNSVNFPSLSSPRAGKNRICVLADNSETIAKVIELANADLTIFSMNSAAKANSAYLIIDTIDAKPGIASAFAKVEGVYKVRVI